jgi:nitrous oxidase accessory protein NosD
MPGAYSGDWYVFRVHDSDRITFRDFQLDGNRWAISSGDEQTHQIQVTYSRDVTITRMFFIRSWGDGVRVLGDETFGVGAPCERVDITDSVFTDMRRNGITVQRAWRGGTIANNTFLLINDGAIDFEPTGCATSAQEGCTGPLLITSNRIYQAGNHAVAVTLTGSTGVQFVNNTVYGNVQGVHVRNAVIANNIINASQTTNFRPIIDIIRDSYRVTVKDNILTGSGGKEMGISFKLNNGSAPHDISIKDNDITGVQTGVHLIGVGLARVKDNAITAWEVGVYADAREGFPIYALQVFSNQIRGPKYGILLVAKSGDVLVSAVRLNTIVEWTVEAIRYASKPEYIMDVSESDNLVD